MVFYEKLKLLMQEKGCTQKELSQELGIGKNQFAYWKEKSNIPSGEILKKIADFLGVSTDYLTGKTNIKNPLDQLDKIEGQFELSETEKEVIKNYRQKSSEMQFAIKIMLGMSEEQKKL